MKNLAERIAEAHDACNDGRISRACNLLRKLHDDLLDAAEPVARNDGMPASADERRLRRMYAARVGMPHTYMDDGEASGQEHGISIDFMREPVADIAAKVLALEVARYECKPAQDDAPQPPAAPSDDFERGRQQGMQQERALWQLAADGQAMEKPAAPADGVFHKAIATTNPHCTAPHAPAAPVLRRLTDAARDVMAERERQVTAEGWTPEHDDEHTSGGMAVAAACYAAWSLPSRPASETVATLWPWTGWSNQWFKPKDTRHNLIRAAALLLAEIERLDRAAKNGARIEDSEVK